LLPLLLSALSPRIVTLACPAAIVVSVFMPAEPLLWLGFQHSTLVSSWRRYFKFSFVLEQKLDQDGRYIFAGARAHAGNWCAGAGNAPWCTGAEPQPKHPAVMQ
jgi:hypothetical protein